MDLDRLDEFVTIAQEGSIKNAALVLGIAPNVLSARLKNFENSLHTELMIRNSHGINLTTSGQIILENSIDIITSYRNIRRRISEMNEDQFHSLTFEICGNTMAPEIGIFMDMYNRNHPQVQINLLGDHSYQLEHGLSSGNVDLFVVYSLSPELNTPYESFCFYQTQRLSVYVANDHPLASKRQVSFEDLNGECFLLYPEASENCMRENQIACLNKSGIEYTIYDGVYDAEFYRLLVPIGKGITISPLINLTPPNSSVLQLTDSGYEFYAHLVYRYDTTNLATLNFVSEFQKFLKRDQS